jgi:pantothenate kinase
MNRSQTTEYAQLFEERLKIKFEKEDEMHTLITGLNFLLQNIPECVTHIAPIYSFQ